MKRFKKELSWLLVAALVVSSLVVGIGQLQAEAVANVGTGLVRVIIQINANDTSCGGDASKGTDSSFRLQFLNAGGTVISATPDNAIEGRPEYSSWGDPLENNQTTTYGSTAGAGGNVQFIAPSLGTMTVNNTITQVQLVNTYWEDDWRFNAITFQYSYDGGTNWVTIASGGEWRITSSGAVGTWAITWFGSNVKTLAFNANGGSGGGTYEAIPGQTITQPAAATRTGYTFAGWSGVPARMPNANATYYAAWNVNYYDLTFNANGGSGGTGPTSTAYGSAISAPTVSRTGYTFTGWSPTVPATMPSAASTYTAQWSINSYTITFDGNGGSTPSAITQNYGTAVTAPANPTRTGYTFTGWSPAVPATMPAGNTTCVAQWSINNYWVYFDEAGGSTVADINQNYGTTITAPANPTRTGYTFAGWSPAVPGTMPANNTTCVAQWTLNSYTITWNPNGGTGGGSNSVNHGVTPTPIDPGTRTGYTFTGWSPAIVPATGPATYTAQWSINSYTISFDSAGGSAVSPITQNYGTTVTAPANPTRTGYTFNGWSPAVPATMPANNTTCVAQWTINQYTISFNSNGGSAVGSITQNYGTQVSAPTAPTKTGNNFAGWYSDPGLANAVSWPYTITGNVTFYAKWTVNSYSITFDANGGTGGTGPTSMVYGSALSAPTVTRTGYTFSSWSPAVPSTVPAANTTYVAQWTINQYTVSFDSNGGSAVGSITQNYGTQVSAPAAPTKTGNTFVAWYSDAGLTTPVSWPFTLGAVNVTFYAKWTVNSYTIYFDEAGGSAVSDITQSYGTAVNAPAAPTKTGYTFLGWSPAVPAAMPAQDTYCVAQWSVNSYNLTFDANGGTGGTGPTATEYGAAISAPTVTRTGYTFTGWDPAVAATMPAADTTYTAQWTINSYTITWAANGGTGGGTNSCDHGATPTPVDAGTKEGYTFTGWDPAIVAATGDTTYTAQWTINSYNLTFDANGGTGGTGPTSTEYGAAISAPTVTRTGYTFTGWDPAVAATMPAADTTYTAQWTINSYNLTFDANGGTGGSGPTSTEYGAAISAPTVTRTGYTFTGWDPAVAATMPAADTTYTAQWTINSYNLTFDANGGSGGTGPTATEYGAAISAPTVTRTGFTFTGWDPAVAVTMPAADTTYTAQWTAATVTITFDANGGTGGWSQDLTIGDPLVAPEVTRSGYSFDGWDPAVPETVPGTAATYTAQWVEIQLIPGDGTATVIDNTNLFIYGLEQYTSQEDFESLFVDVLGDGRIEVTPTVNGFGTGTKVDLIDNATEEVIASYYIVIFGDINGDGIAGSVDIDLIANYENYIIEWDYETEPYLFMAGDLDGNTIVEALDADIIANVENYLMWIDQTTGLAYSY